MPRKRSREEKQDRSHLRTEPIESDSHYQSKVFDHNLFQRKGDEEDDLSLMYRCKYSKKRKRLRFEPDS